MSCKGLIFRHLLLVFLSFGQWGMLGAQPLFEHITSDDGLSENVVNCIFQDSRGFMWFGTNDGLCKYDGYRFTTYKPKTREEGGISSNLIFAISEDRQGNIWIGTTGSGICKFNPQTEQFTSFKYDPQNTTGLSNNYITAIFSDSKGRVWVGTHNFLNVFDPTVEHIRFHHYKIAQQVNIKSISRIREDKKGNIWVGCREGIFRSFDTDKLDQFDFQRMPIDKDNTFDLIIDFAFDLHNRLVIVNGGNILYQREDNEMLFTEIGSTANIRRFIIDDQNKIWIGSDSGLYCYESPGNGQAPRFTHHYTHDNMNPRSLSRNLVNSMFKDRSGIVWLGVNGGGLNKFDPNRKAFSHIASLSANKGGNEKIRSVLEDSRGNLWIGTEGDGLFWKNFAENDKLERGFQHFNVPNRPFALAEVKLGNKKWLFAGSEDSPALCRLDISSNQPEVIEDLVGEFSSVFAIIQDRHENIWIGTYNGGLHRWKPSADGNSFEKTVFRYDAHNPTSLSNNIVRKVLQDSRGNIWIGTGNGLCKIAPDQVNNKQVQFEIFRSNPDVENSLTHNYILDILESASGDIWLGTFGGGLNKLVSSADGTPPHFEHFSEEDGLANNIVKSILEDKDGNIWLSSNKGLSKINPQSRAVFNYNLSDGLQANEFSEEAAFYRNNGEMIFGGTNGFNIFYPEKIEANTSQPEVIFTALYIFNEIIQPQRKYNGRRILEKSLSFTDHINLNYKENNFSIEFAALDFAAPQQIQYVYMLEGYDEKWKSTSLSNRQATYTNLRHGTYSLKVKASNADGVWSNKISELTITIDPPVWLTWYAYAFYLSLGIALLWFFRKYELIGIQEKHDLRMARLERAKREEVHDLKLRFFTNISHELRTPLTLIIAPLENLMKKGTHLTQEKISAQYHLMYKNSKYLLRLVDQLLDFRKLDQGKLNLEAKQGDFVKFVKEATEPFQFIASKQDIEFEIFSDDDKIYLWFDQDIAEKILYNLLSNAFKFTPAGGKVHVQLREVEDEKNERSRKHKMHHYLELSIIDTGIGISPKTVKRIFERFYKEGGDKFTSDGAGIGLSFTQSLVKRHYGEIFVKSKKGEGSTFTVRLPMSKSVFAKGEISNGKIKAHQFSTDPLEYFSPEKPAILPTIEATPLPQEPSEQLPLLLFVDDNKDIRKFIKSGFENDFRIIEAENGQKGVEIAKSSIPDIIISDIMMPEMDGIQMCNLLKSSVDTSHIPIVLLTAKTNTESELEGLETGADAYVRKPFQLDILKQQILNIYHQREKLKSRFRQEVILQPKEITVTTVDEEFLQRAMDLIEEHMSDAEFNVEALVKEMYISRSKLYLKIKALTGYSTSEFIRTVRLKRAVQLLEKSDFTIKEIMFMTGFNTASYFSKCFKKLYGIVPSEYVRKKQELRIQEKEVGSP